MKNIIIIAFSILMSSCIPIRIAPNIKEDKVMMGKKFKRKLPKRYAFIFEDPKDANEFYNYINTKYELDAVDVESNVSFSSNEKDYYFSFYEVEIPTKTINLIPILIDAKMEQEGVDPFLEDAEFSRVGNWYLALTVSDINHTDCLNPEYPNREAVLKYLKAMRIEYLNTQNYIEALLRK